MQSCMKSQGSKVPDAQASTAATDTAKLMLNRNLLYQRVASFCAPCLHCKSRTLR